MVEGREISPSTLSSIRPRASRWTALLYLRFVLLQPVEAALKTLEIRESTLETLEIRATPETLELLALETLETLEMLALETLETLEMLESYGVPGE